MVSYSVKSKAKRQRVSFKLSAPGVKVVFLAGDFNGWDPKSKAMNNSGRDLWEKTIVLPLGRYEYKFVVDGTWRMDPDNQVLCQNCFGTQNNVLNID